MAAGRVGGVRDVSAGLGGAMRVWRWCRTSGRSAGRECGAWRRDARVAVVQDEWEECGTEGSDAEGEELAEAARERAEAAMDDADWDQVL